jgi:hypothetical protein
MEIQSPSRVQQHPEARCDARVVASLGPLPHNRGSVDGGASVQSAASRRRTASGRWWWSPSRSAGRWRRTNRPSSAGSPLPRESSCRDCPLCWCRCRSRSEPPQRVFRHPQSHALAPTGSRRREVCHCHLEYQESTLTPKGLRNSLISFSEICSCNNTSIFWSSDRNSLSYCMARVIVYLADSVFSTCRTRPCRGHINDSIFLLIALSQRKRSLFSIPIL